LKKVEVFTDGASRGNPGKASFGVVITVDGDTVIEESHEIGIKTNNTAEYAGLIFALSMLLALKLEKEQITLNSDSEFMVKQIHGQYRLKKEELAEYYLVAKNLLMRFPKIEIKHVKREKNAKADKLANLALDEGGLWKI